MNEQTDLRIVVERLRLYGHVQRLSLLGLLLGAEMSVGELEQRSGIGQPALSQQLGELRRAAVVEVRSRGKQKIYRLAVGEDERVRSVLALMRASGSGSAAPRSGRGGDIAGALPRDRSGALFPRILQS